MAKKETGGKGNRHGLAISAAISLCSQQNSEKIMHEESAREALSVRLDTKRRPERLDRALLCPTQPFEVGVLVSLLKQITSSKPDTHHHNTQTALTIPVSMMLV